MGSDRDDIGLGAAMTDTSNLGVLLALLDDECGLGKLCQSKSRGGVIGENRRRDIVERVRTDAEAQLTLFLLALEINAETVASSSALREDLLTFAAAAHEAFGVNLLRTAAAHPERMPARLPEGLLSEERVERVENGRDSVEKGQSDGAARI